MKTKKYLIIIIALIATFFLGYCTNQKLNHNHQTIVEFTNDTIAINDTIVVVDSLIINDTIVVFNVDSVYFTINSPSIINSNDIIKYIDTNFISEDSPSVLRKYEDSLIIDGIKLHSTVVTSGILYQNKLTYELYDTSIYKTILINRDSTFYNTTIINNTKLKPDMLQLYIGSTFYTNSFDIRNVTNLSFAPKLSVNIKEKHLLSYQYDVLSNMHGITYQHRLFTKKQKK